MSQKILKFVNIISNIFVTDNYKRIFRRLLIIWGSCKTIRFKFLERTIMKGLILPKIISNILAISLRRRIDQIHRRRGWWSLDLDRTMHRRSSFNFWGILKRWRLCPSMNYNRKSSERIRENFHHNQAICVRRWLGMSKINSIQWRSSEFVLLVGGVQISF